MKKSIYVMTFLCILFSGCNKIDWGSDGKEDLSYLIQTYNHYESNGNVYETRRTYDGYKMTSYKYYINGQLYQENKNYSYDGLKATWDAYSYQIDAVTSTSSCSHVECEYLDKTYLRIKHQRSESSASDPQNVNISEIYYEYDGKKPISYKSYSNGVLTIEGHDYHYDGLHCTYTTTYYSLGEIYQENSYVIDYLDDTYRRQKSYTRTRQRFIDGEVYSTQTLYTTYEYDGKKVIGSRSYSNGVLSSVGRDYNYDGLDCYYYVDSYRDGEVNATTLYQVEYLK